MYKTGLIATVILVVVTRVIFCGDVQKVTNYDEFIQAANDHTAALLIGCEGCGNCSLVMDQMKAVCQKRQDVMCFSSYNLPDKAAIDEAFEKLTVEWTPYLVFFSNNNVICSLDKECDMGDNNYIEDGFQVYDSTTKT